MTISRTVDILILGGGAAGLSSALTLSRQLHTAVVFDNGVHRNAISQHMHNVLTWDNRHPKDFIEAGRKNLLSNYQTVQFCECEVREVKRTEIGQFEAHTAGDQIWTGSKLILATGVEDILPDLPGYKDCWFASSMYEFDLSLFPYEHLHFCSAITSLTDCNPCFCFNLRFHCFFCHGYEARGSDSAGILAIDGHTTVPSVLHFARNAKRFAKSVAIYTNGSVELATEVETALGSTPGFVVNSGEIARLIKGERGSEVVVQLASGSEQLQAFLGHKPRTRMNGPWAEQLGLEMAPSGDPKAHPPFFATSVRGVFLCGDLSSPLKIVPNAMLSGAAAGAGACAELQAEMVGQESMVSVVSKN